MASLKTFCEISRSGGANFVDIFRLIGRSFCSDLAIGELKIGFHAKGEGFYVFLLSERVPVQ